MSQPETQEPTVSEEFIAQNRGAQLGTTRQGGPYSRGQRRKRRQEIFRLHFEQGIPAIQIADLMKVNKNTVNADIQWLYTKMSQDIEGEEFNGFFVKQLVRLEIQRSRLMSYLSEAKNLDTKLAVERQLGEHDFRLAAMVEKYKESTFAFWDKVAQKINELAEAEGLQNRYSTVYELQKISPARRKLMDKALEKEETK